MTNSSVFRADITRFKSSIPTDYSGELLEQVNALRQSIQNFGLFSPILVERVGTTLSVIDGRKRLAALQGLVNAGLAPRDLIKIPYVITANARKSTSFVSRKHLSLLSNRQQYHLLLRLIEKGLSGPAIAKAMYVPEAYVKKLGSISRLSRKLKQAVLTNTLSFSQGQAFATLPNHRSQERLLDLLGAFVDAPTIIAAIEAGEPVVSCDDTDDNVIIMPSRGTRSQIAAACAA